MLGWEPSLGLELHNLGSILHIWGFVFCSALVFVSFKNLQETLEAEARKRGKKSSISA